VPVRLYRIRGGGCWLSSQIRLSTTTVGIEGSLKNFEKRSKLTMDVSSFDYYHILAIYLQYLHYTAGYSTYNSMVVVILLVKICLDAGCLTLSAISFEGEAEYLVVLNIKVQPHIVNFSISSRDRPGTFFILMPDQRRTSNLKTRKLFTFRFPLENGRKNNVGSSNSIRRFEPAVISRDSPTRP
jgi:hypothetical protein